MKPRKLLPFVTLAFALSACEQPTTVALDVQPAFAAAPAACQGQITSIIASTWPWAHNNKVAFPPPPGSVALWLQEIGEPFFGVSTVRELQALFCGAGSGSMATGSGHMVDTRGANPDFRNFSFVAHSNGQFQVVNRTFDVRLHGSVECVSVVGNQAWFAGTVTQSNDPGRVGRIRGFRVVDNGEGKNHPPDQIANSVRLRTISAQDWCDLTPVRALLDIEQGNIQVH